MPATPIATNFNEALDIKINLFAQLTFNPVLPVNKLSETINLVFSKITHLGIRADTGPV